MGACGALALAAEPPRLPTPADKTATDLPAYAGPVATLAEALKSGRLPREAVDEARLNGSAFVLIKLALPGGWQPEHLRSRHARGRHRCRWRTAIGVHRRCPGRAADLDTDPPAAPTNLHVCGAQPDELCLVGQTKLIWSDNSHNEDRFEFEWTTAQACGPATSPAAPVTPTRSRTQYRELSG